MRTFTARERGLSVGVSAAAVGALAATLTVAPASADTVSARAPQGLVPQHSGTHQLSATPMHARVAPAAVAPASYTVRAGDTVWSIAKKHGLRTADVLAWNGMTARSVIYPGQKLKLKKPAAAARPAATAPAAVKPKTHTVAKGDTVYGIARKYGTSVSAILAANHLGASAVIHPGQRLIVSGAASARPAAAKPASKPASAAAKTHTVATGDTVYSIARKYGTSVSAILAANRLGGSAIIYPGQKLVLQAAKPAPASAVRPAAKPAAAKTHTVAAGDSLYTIAKKYRTTVAVILEANDLGASSIIYPGQKLKLTLPADTQRSARLDAQQTANARLIIRVGRQLGVPDRGIQIALATSMVESSMRNLNGGDRDSLGLFQQRPSQGWGTKAQIMNAERSVRVFYGGASDPNGKKSRGLLDVRGWQSKSFGGAAQAVQISDYAHRYGQWEQQARRWLSALG
ncbi:LysM peptidoglycan-binding domain-containing protein [Microbacterium sp. NPDC057659]|uniref:muramidase family protein n=1 Tax=Microbacterium sp. NPDC057659 TaxID=3346198 RepID=UPI00366FD667